MLLEYSGAAWAGLFRQQASSTSSSLLLSPSSELRRGPGLAIHERAYKGTGWVNDLGGALYLPIVRPVDVNDAGADSCSSSPAAAVRIKGWVLLYGGGQEKEANGGEMDPTRKKSKK